MLRPFDDSGFSISSYWRIDLAQSVTVMFMAERVDNCDFAKEYKIVRLTDLKINFNILYLVAKC